jgi:hypothetical protein
MARTLRDRCIPQSERFAATIMLLPDGASPTTITAQGCWWKPLDVRQTTYGGVAIEGTERIINIPAEQVNDPGETQEIRRRDKITVDSVVYRVLSAGLRSVSSRWECLVNEVDS